MDLVHEIGDFRAARTAPRRPEIQDDDLAFEIRGTNRLAVQVFKFPIWRGRGITGVYCIYWRRAQGRRRKGNGRRQNDRKHAADF